MDKTPYPQNQPNPTAPTPQASPTPVMPDETTEAPIQSPDQNPQHPEHPTTPPISEEAARDLLRAEKAQAEHNYRKIQQKNRKTLIIVIVVAVILCALGAVFALMMAGRHQDTTTPNPAPGNSETTDPEQPDQPENPSEMTEAEKEAAVKETVEAAKTMIMDYINADGVIAETEDRTETMLLYQPEGAKLPMQVGNTVGFAIATVGWFGEPGSTADNAEYDKLMAVLESETLATKIYDFFAARGFTNSASDPVGIRSFNEQTGILCESVMSGMPSVVTCGHISWIKAEDIDLVNELATAVEASGIQVRTILASTQGIKDSTVEPYQTLNGSLIQGMTGAMGLFYRTSPEAEWQFFKGTQAVLLCSEYDTDDVRKAFAGEVCYDESSATNSTVQP